MNRLAVRTPKGARRVIWGIVACILALVLLAGFLISNYQIDRVEDQDQIVALEDAVNALADQLKEEGVEPVVDSAAEVDPSGGIGPIGPPGRDGRDGIGTQGAPGVSGAVGATGVGEPGAVGAAGEPGPAGSAGDPGVPGPQGDPGVVGGQGIPGPDGPVCPAGYTAQDRVELPSTETWFVCVQNPL